MIRENGSRPLENRFSDGLGGYRLVKSPSEILGNEKNVAFILFISRRNSLTEVHGALDEAGYIYGQDYIDATNLYDNSGQLITKYRYDDISINDIYAPWMSDDKFADIMSGISEYTLVDKLRCYELWKLVEQTARCKEGSLLEVGVWRGGTGALIASAATTFNISETVYLADTFEGVVKVSKRDLSYVGGEHNDTSEDTVASLLSEMKLTNVSIKKGIFPDDFGDEFDKTIFRFVHIDVDVYRSAKEVFEYIWRNVTRGGCVVFDDYGNMYTDGVTELCEELSKKISDCIFIYNMNKHGVFIKL